MAYNFRNGNVSKYIGQVDVEIVTASGVSVIVGVSFSHPDFVSGQVCAATSSFPSMARIAAVRKIIIPTLYSVMYKGNPAFVLGAISGKAGHPRGVLEFFLKNSLKN